MQTQVPDPGSYTSLVLVHVQVGPLIIECNGHKLHVVGLIGRLLMQLHDGDTHDICEFVHEQTVVNEACGQYELIGHVLQEPADRNASVAHRHVFVVESYT